MKKNIMMTIIAVMLMAAMTGCGKEDAGLEAPATENIERTKTPDTDTAESVDVENDIEDTETSAKAETETTVEDADADVTEEEPVSDVTEQEESEEPEITFTKTEVDETIYATTSANVRKGPSTDFDVVGRVKLGDEIKRTGILDNGWSEIEYKGATCYISSKLVSTEKPVIPEPTPAPTPAPTPEQGGQQAGTMETKTLFGTTRYQSCTTPGGVKIWTTKPDSCGWKDYILNAIDAAGITNEMSEYEKCVAINNYICAVVNYAYDYRDPVGTPFDQSLFTDYSLVIGYADCGGYADAFQSMCVAVGMECYRDGGRANNGAETVGHWWNYVLADGVGYYVDTCWNDGTGNAYLMSTTCWDDHYSDGMIK